MMKLAVLTTLVGSATAFAPVAFKVRHGGIWPICRNVLIFVERPKGIGTSCAHFFGVLMVMTNARNV